MTTSPSPAGQRRLEHPTTRLWSSFDDETPQRSRLTILCGVPPQLADDVMLLAMARSRPAVRLVARRDEMLRSLAHQTVVATERCVGHVRGPILWSETITAWASGVGVDDVFVCASPRRDFDVVENRLLVWLLQRLVAAGRRASGDGRVFFTREIVERVVTHGHVAQDLLAHRNLRGVTRRRPTGKELRMVRQSRHRATYAVALRLAERVSAPFDADEVRGLCTQTTVEHHRVIGAIADAMAARGLAVPQLRVRGDMVEMGPLRYRNPAIFPDRRISGRSGLYWGDVRVSTIADDPPAEGRGEDAAAHPRVVVASPDDAQRLVDEMLDARRSRTAEVEGANLVRGQSASGLTQRPSSE